MSDEHIDMDVELGFVKTQDRLTEIVKEQLLENNELHEHILDQIQYYWGRSFGFDVRGPLTDFQEEFVCQCQVQLMNRFLAKVMVS